MPRLPVRLLVGFLLLVSACTSGPRPKTQLTDAELEQTTANPLPEADTAAEIQSLPSGKKPLFQSDSTRIDTPTRPPDPSQPWLHGQGAFPLLQR